jgi:hypothetical protein
VLAKEVSAFNIRTLAVVCGAFNTQIGGESGVSTGSVPLPDAYKGSMVERMQTMVTDPVVAARFANSDKDKGMKALFEVVIGDGVGKGREQEKFIPLGTDMATRVQGTRDMMAHALEVWADVTNGVGIEK